MTILNMKNLKKTKTDKDASWKIIILNKKNIIITVLETSNLEKDNSEKETSGNDHSGKEKDKCEQEEI